MLKCDAFWARRFDYVSLFLVRCVRISFSAIKCFPWISAVLYGWCGRARSYPMFVHAHSVLGTVMSFARPSYNHQALKRDRESRD